MPAAGGGGNGGSGATAAVEGPLTPGMGAPYARGQELQLLAPLDTTARSFDNPLSDE